MEFSYITTGVLRTSVFFNERVLFALLHKRLSQIVTYVSKIILLFLATIFSDDFVNDNILLLRSSDACAFYHNNIFYNLVLQEITTVDRRGRPANVTPLSTAIRPIITRLKSELGLDLLPDLSRNNISHLLHEEFNLLLTNSSELVASNLATEQKLCLFSQILRINYGYALDSDVDFTYSNLDFTLSQERVNRLKFLRDTAFKFIRGSILDLNNLVLPSYQTVRTLFQFTTFGEGISSRGLNEPPLSIF